MSPKLINESDIRPIARSRIVALGQGQYWLSESFESGTDVLGCKLTIPKGYTTDGASIPRFFWRWIGHPLEGEFQDAAIAHDWRCDRAIELDCYEKRIIADAVFRYELRLGTVPGWKRRLMYFAVRINGWWTFCILKPKKKVN